VKVKSISGAAGFKNSGRSRQKKEMSLRRNAIWIWIEILFDMGISRTVRRGRGKEGFTLRNDRPHASFNFKGFPVPNRKKQRFFFRLEPSGSHYIEGPILFFPGNGNFLLPCRFSLVT
jgi:hypothetical protein